MRPTLNTLSKTAAALLLLAGTCTTTWADETTLLKGDTDLLNRKVPTAPENRRVTIVTNTQ